MKKGFTVICENCGEKSSISNWNEYERSNFHIVAYNKYDTHDYEIYCTKCNNEIELKSK